MNTADADNDTIFFADYNEDTLDPGWSLLVGCLTACILLFATLPCVVSLSSRYERRKRTSRAGERADESTDEEVEEDNEAANDLPTDDEHDGDLQRVESMIDLGCLNSRDEGEDSDSSGLEQVSLTRIPSELPVPPPRQATVPTNEEEPETIQIDTDDKAIVVKSLGAVFADWICALADTCTPYSEKQLHSRSRSRDPRLPGIQQGKEPTGPITFSRPFSFLEQGQEIIRQSTAFPSVLLQHQQSGAVPVRPPKSRKKKDRRCDVSRHSSNNSNSAMSRLHQDDVSFTEAIDKYGPAKSHQRGPGPHTMAEVDLVCGERAWWRPAMVMEGFDRLVSISECDDEMMALVRSAIPFSGQAFVTGFLNLLDVALVGQRLGTREASIFVMVSLLTWLPTTFVYGFAEALAKLVPAALEVDRNAKAGNYLSTSFAFFTLFMIPIGVFWSFQMSNALVWFGFDRDTADEAESYAQVHVALEYLTGIGYAFHLFLDVTGHQRFSTFSNTAFGLGQTVGVVIPVFVMSERQDAIVYVAISRTLIAVIHFIGSGIIATYLGWLDDYCTGMLEIPFRDWSVAKEVFHTASPLGVAYFLAYGEWEFLAFFAKALGPAEVVTWAMLGYLWYLLKYLADGIADSAELRCGHHLLCNNPQMARVSAQKSHFLGLSVSLLLTSILFMTGKELTEWVTQDVVLQTLMLEILPLIGIGFVVQTSGLISASVLGAQGRSGMAHLVQFLGAWCVTVLVSFVFCFVLLIDLQGLSSAVVLGLALSGAGQTCLMMRSDWEHLASTLSKGLEAVDKGSSPPP